MVTSQNIYTIGVVTGCAAVTETLPVSLTAVCLGFTFLTLSILLIHSAVLLHTLTYNIRKHESEEKYFNQFGPADVIHIQNNPLHSFPKKLKQTR